MTELSYLIHLLLDHKLTLKTKSSIKDRIAEIETRGYPQPQPQRAQNTHQALQSPSMQAKIEAMEQDKLNTPPNSNSPIQATTQAASQALQDRARLINQAINGYEDKTRTSPRKF